MRGETFVTRKITRAVAAIEHGLQEVLYIGNPMPSATGATPKTSSTWLICNNKSQMTSCWPQARATACVNSLSSPGRGRNVVWKGSGNDEVGFDRASAKELVKINQRYFRPTEVDALLGDASKAHRELGWKAETSFKALVAEMVTSDLELIRSDPNAVARVNY